MFGYYFDLALRSFRRNRVLTALMVLAIARALAGSPRLLLADEPTGNLDTLMARGVMELLEEINRQGTTIIMVTHDPELAARAQRNVHVIDGQVTDFESEPQLRVPAPSSGAAVTA